MTQAVAPRKGGVTKDSSEPVRIVPGSGRSVRATAHAINRLRMEIEHGDRPARPRHQRADHDADCADRRGDDNRQEDRPQIERIAIGGNEIAEAVMPFDLQQSDLVRDEEARLHEVDRRQHDQDKQGERDKYPDNSGLVGALDPGQRNGQRRRHAETLKSLKEGVGAAVRMRRRRAAIIGLNPELLPEGLTNGLPHFHGLVRVHRHELQLAQRYLRLRVLHAGMSHIKSAICQDLLRLKAE